MSLLESSVDRSQHWREKDLENFEEGTPKGSRVKGTYRVLS